MDKHPVTPERRRRYEAAIRWLDMICYLAVFASGAYGLLFTPDTVTLELTGFRWLIAVWTSLLLIGGVAGFVGRLTRYWVIEAPGTVAAMFGVSIYVVILAKVALLSTTAAVATALAFVAMLLMLRRYLELQLFSSDPGQRAFPDRLAAMIARRTHDVAPRHE